MGWVRRRFHRSINAISEAACELFAMMTGYEIDRFGWRAIVLVRRTCRQGAWFSENSVLKTTIDSQRIDLVIDVGANRGQFAKKLRKFYAGEILSFEPLPDVFKLLAESAAGDPKWKVFQLALGSRPGEQQLNVTPVRVFSSLLPPNQYAAERFGNSAQTVHQEKVTVDRLDLVLERTYPDIDRRNILLKLDTQGYDAEVFRGAGRFCHSIRGLQSELSLMPLYDGMPHWTDSIEEYEAVGLQVVSLLPVAHDAGKVIEFDCLMVRAGSPPRP